MRDAVALALTDATPARSSAGKTRNVPPPASALTAPPRSAVIIRRTNVTGCRRALLSPFQNCRYHTRISASMEHGHNPQRSFVRRICNHAFTDQLETDQRPNRIEDFSHYQVGGVRTMRGY